MRERLRRDRLQRRRGGNTVDKDRREQGVGHRQEQRNEGVRRLPLGLTSSPCTTKTTVLPRPRRHSGPSHVRSSRPPTVLSLDRPVRRRSLLPVSTLPWGTGRTEVVAYLGPRRRRHFHQCSVPVSLWTSPRGWV